MEKLFEGGGIRIIVHVLVLAMLCLGGCGPVVSSGEEVTRFEVAGPVASLTGGDETRVQSRMGRYRVVCGDLLELQTPTIFLVIFARLNKEERNPAAKAIRELLWRH